MALVFASSARLIQFPCNMSAVLILGWTGVQMITEPQFYTLQPAIFFHTENTIVLSREGVMVAG